MTPADWKLSIPDSVERSDVSLINNSRINVLGSGGGSIAVTSRSLSLSNISRLRVGFDANSGSEGAQAGDLVLNATGTIDLRDRATLRIEGLPGSTGNVGDMTITTGSFLLSGGSQLIAVASGRGDVGNVMINARDTVSFDDSSIFGAVQTNATGNTGSIMIRTGSFAFTAGSELISNVRGQGSTGRVTINAIDRVSIDGSFLFNTVESAGVGSASGITISTGSLALTGGAQLISSTSGRGNAGKVTISATDRVSLDGEISDGGFASTIFTRLEPGAIGQGGDVTIATGSLFLTNGGAINTANVGGRGDAGRVIIQVRDAIQIRGTAPTITENRSGVFTSATPGSVGNGGDILINTGSLSVSDQGRIITNAEAQGNAGKIQIQARDTVLFDGGDAITTLLSTGTGRGGDIDLTARSLSLRNGAQLTASTSGAGRAGNIQVKVGDLQIAKGAEASVSSSSQEQAGFLSIEANRILLDSGKIQADTSGGGGNIELRSPLILLRNGSNITTNATGPNIPGGGIAIASRFLVAVPQEDSNISANSEDFRGGSIGIKAVAIYGIQPQPRLTDLSDITATGATSTLSGTVQLNLEPIDPTSSLAELPTTVGDSSRLIAQGCPADQGNSFLISGRGGLPPTPEQQLDDDAAWQDLRQVTAQQTDRSRITTNAPMIEATGWHRTPTGRIILVANAPHSTFQNRSISCNERSGVTP